MITHGLPHRQGGRIEKVHISLIAPGDVVRCGDGFDRTVSARSIKKGFCGLSLWGDSYRCGTVSVVRVLADAQGGAYR